ncbi:MAG: response regulator [Myxococcales bacterium]|nr:response regulator [Myxococcales bacterium]MCB9756658.1 response regulator [Myxococcales bacterium]
MNGHTGRLLLVTREAGAHARIARSLARRGHVIVCVRDGDVALALLERERFDIVLLDVVRSAWSGDRVLERLRRLARRPSVIAMTDAGDREALARCREHGARAVLQRPLDSLSLWEAVEMSLKTT